MITIGTLVSIADNSGALLGLCLNTYKLSGKKGVLPGQLLTLNIKKNILKKHIIKKSRIIVKGQICRAIVIRSLRGIKRWGNFFLKCGINAAVVLNQYRAPYATRLIGTLFREIRLTLLFRKLLNMATNTI